MRWIQIGLSWLLALFVAGVFLQAALAFKFADAPGENIIFATIAARSQIAFFEPGVRFLVGIAEVFAAALIIPPWTRRLGAVLAAGVLIGAIAFHLSPWLGIAVPTSLADNAPNDGGMLFFLACAALAASVANIFLTPSPAKRGPARGRGFRAAR